MTVSNEDFEMVRGCLGGEINEFRGLVEKYQERIYLVIFGIIRNREQAQDLTQEVFLKAYRSLKKFKGKSQFYTWLYRIAFNLALDNKRKQAGRVQVEYDDSMAIADISRKRVGQSPRPDREALRGELYEVILGGLDLLSVEQKTAIMLREWEGYSYQEISEIMDCSPGTVMSRLHYARERLREHLKPYLSEVKPARPGS
ncbi:MAG: sigma-70 family RNA polymerase sigma factor [Candidatus Auribacterota bacterium]|nr:sigma-70 family RNA polymerase sigma factor [Candidatus Auribacterota bacterium]